MTTHVIGWPPANQRFSSSWRRVKLQERILEMIVHFEDGSLVTTSIAVVGSREDGDDVTFL